MSKTAQLADGTTLEFPDETPDAVMDKVVQEHVSGKVQPAPAPATSSAFSGITGKAVNYGMQMARDIGGDMSSSASRIVPPTEEPKSVGEAVGRALTSTGNIVGGLVGIPYSFITGPIRTVSRSGGDIARTAGASERVAGGIETGLNLFGNLVAAPYAAKKIMPMIVKAVENLPGAQMTLRALGQKEIESIPTSMTPPVPSKELYAKVAEAGGPSVPLTNLKSTMANLSTEQKALQRAGKETSAVMKMASKVVPAETPIPAGYSEEAQAYIAKELKRQGIAGTEAIPFKDAQALLTQYGLDSQSADATIRRANKMAYGALAKDLEAAGGAYPELQAANKTFAREKSLKELQDILDKHIGQQLEGRPKEFTSSAFAATLKEIKKTENTDPLFARGFTNNPAWGEQAGGSQLDIIKAKLSDLATLRVASAPQGQAVGSSLNVMRAARGGLASGATTMAEWGLGTTMPGLSLVVGSTVALTPIAISKALQSERGTRMLATLIKSGAQIDPKTIAVILASTRLDSPEVKQFMGNYSNIMNDTTSIQDKVAAAQKRDQLNMVNQEIQKAVNQ